MSMQPDMRSEAHTPAGPVAQAAPQTADEPGQTAKPVKPAKPAKRKSIRLSLLKRMIVPLLAIHLLSAGMTYCLAWRPAETAFDQSLADAGWALIPQLRELRGGVQIDLPHELEQMLRMDHFDAIYFTVRTLSGLTLAGDRDFPALREPDQNDTPLAYDGSIRGKEIRIISLRTNIGAETVTIGVGETLAKRSDLRASMLVSLVLLEGFLTAITMLIVWFAVGTGLKPLQRLQIELNQRDDDDLSALGQTHMPTELHPLVSSLNAMLHRIHAGIVARQDFLANVAHQLRTPLAGLRVQLEWLQQRYQSEPETAASAAMMMLSTERMIRQTNQFMALARAEPSQFEKTRLEPLRLDRLVGEAVQQFVEEADKKDIDLGFDLRPATVLGDRFLLRDLIDNLTDNAIQYSPSHGTVTVRCEERAGQVVLLVEDQGRGIGAADRELIFKRHYRVDDRIPGNGLGLAIVLDIVKDHGAEIRIDEGPDGLGTTFSVHFPPVVPVLRD
ncbi:MAG: sensor histidine kinase [Janthinobacterium lividum]